MAFVFFAVFSGFSYQAAIAWWKQQQPTAGEQARWKEESRERKAMQASDEAYLKSVYRIDSLACRAGARPGTHAVMVYMKGKRPGPYRLTLDLNSPLPNTTLREQVRDVTLRREMEKEEFLFSDDSLQSAWCSLVAPRGNRYAFGSDQGLGLNAILIPLDTDSALAARVGGYRSSSAPGGMAIRFMCSPKSGPGVGPPMRGRSDGP
jgi:hypothetical protein